MIEIISDAWKEILAQAEETLDEWDKRLIAKIEKHLSDRYGNMNPPQRALEEALRALREDPHRKSLIKHIIEIRSHAVRTVVFIDNNPENRNQLKIKGIKYD